MFSIDASVPTQTRTFVVAQTQKILPENTQNPTLFLFFAKIAGKIQIKKKPELATLLPSNPTPTNHYYFP